MLVDENELELDVAPSADEVRELKSLRLGIAMLEDMAAEIVVDSERKVENERTVVYRSLE